MNSVLVTVLLRIGRSLSRTHFNFVFFITPEKHNSDWWFVKKHLTDETGWVPSQYLMDADAYAEYVQNKLNEKIDKLPVFESTYRSPEADEIQHFNDVK